MSLVIIIKLLFTLASLGVIGQNIILGSLTTNSPCTPALRSGQDAYILTGEVGDHIIADFARGWQNQITVVVLTSSQAINIVCKFNITIAACNNDPTATCVCQKIDNNVKATFIVRALAITNHSLGALRAEWYHSNGTSVYSQPNYQLPKIVDLENIKLELKLNDVLKPDTVTPRCSFSLNTGELYRLQLCCSNISIPCYPRILVNGFIIAHEKLQCVNTTLILHRGHTDPNITTSFSVCSVSNYRTIKSCIADTVLLIKESGVDLHKTMVTFGVIVTIGVAGISITIGVLKSLHRESNSFLTIGK